MKKQYYFLLFAMAGWFTAAGQNTIYVNKDAEGANNGSSWANAYTSLQAAINASAVNDKIWVSAGTYFPTQLRIAGNARSASFIINKNIKIYGGFNGTETQLSERNTNTNVTILSGDFSENDIDTNGNGINDFNDGENAYNVVFTQNLGTSAILDGFRITGANADGSTTYMIGTSLIQTNTGGAIYNLNSSLTMSNLKLYNNSSDFGAGVYNTGGAPKLNSSELTYNFASYGAGAYNTLATVFTINDCDFFFNRFSGGTVGSVNNSVVKANNCFFAQNSGLYGGAFYNKTASIILFNVKISENIVNNSGGGIYNVDNGVATLFNVLINNNYANNGAGIYNHTNAYSKLTNVTITGNEAVDTGGGIYNNISPDGLNTRIYNSIIWDNTASQSASIYYTFYAQEDVHIRNSIIAGSGGSAAWNDSYGHNQGNNFAQDPLFLNASGGNYMLQDTSVGKDSAYNQLLNLPNGANAWTAADSDPDGYSRLQGAGVDMGAFEAGGVNGVAESQKMNLVYNNPVQKGSILRIIVPQAGNFNVSVFDTQGKLVNKNTFNGESDLNISTNEMAAGIYFCRVSSKDDGTFETIKVIIN